MLSAVPLAACDSADETSSAACDRAARQLEACFGEGSADAFEASCRPSDAERVEGHDCMELTRTLLDEKADSTFDSAVLDAVRDALREAIEAGLRAALQQVVEQLGGVGDYGAYLLLDRADTEAGARAAAEEWARQLEGRPEFQPTVVEYSSGFGVAHAPCVINLDETLPQLVAQMVTSRADTIEVLGGTVERVQQSETEYEMDVRLPLVLLPNPREDQVHPDCSDL